MAMHASVLPAPRPFWKHVRHKMRSSLRLLDRLILALRPCHPGSAKAFRRIGGFLVSEASSNPLDTIRLTWGILDLTFVTAEHAR